LKPAVTLAAAEADVKRVAAEAGGVSGRFQVDHGMPQHPWGSHLTSPFWNIDEDNVGVFLEPAEHDFTSIRGHIEIADEVIGG
jgi:hypothetical protein